MADKLTPKPLIQKTYNMNQDLSQNTGRLLQRIQEILEEARKKVYRTTNTEMLLAYWNIMLCTT